jgi:hypothetical protein
MFTLQFFIRRVITDVVVMGTWEQVRLSEHNRAVSVVLFNMEMALDE